MDALHTKKQFTALALLGLFILVLFAVGLAWLRSYSGVYWTEGADVFLAFSPYWIFLILAVNSVYVGIFAARFAQGRWTHPWMGGITGFVLTLLFILGLPGLLSILFPISGPEIFAGPAIGAFIAPVLSALSIALLINNNKRLS